MSLFGAMNSAISGLTSQSDAFGDISDNVANSQTVGFKRVDTSFVDFLTTSTATRNDPGAVVARPDYVNGVQGTITQTDSPLNLAIAGQGLFAVSQQTGQLAGKPTFNPQQFYSRAGDFSLNSQGYLVNSAGQFLNGWTADPVTGIVNQNALVADPGHADGAQSGGHVERRSGGEPARDAGRRNRHRRIADFLRHHRLRLPRHRAHRHPGLVAEREPNDWTVSVTAPDAVDARAIRHRRGAVRPASASGNPVTAGTIGQISATTGTINAAALRAGSRGDDDHGRWTSARARRPITLNVGTYGGSHRRHAVCRNEPTICRVSVRTACRPATTPGSPCRPTATSS